MVRVACTGEPHCNYAVTETKGKLQEILAHLETRWVTDWAGSGSTWMAAPTACGLHWGGRHAFTPGRTEGRVEETVHVPDVGPKRDGAS